MTLDPVICELAPGDRLEIQDFLRRLDPHTRSQRFGGGVADDWLSDYGRSLEQPQVLLFGAWIDGRLRGLSELHPSMAPGDVCASEAALVVERPFRNRRLGTSLLEAALTAAKDKGYRCVRIACHRTNWAMRKLARSARARLDLSLDEMTGEIAL